MNVALALSVDVLDSAAMVQQLSPMWVANERVWTPIPRINVRHETVFYGGGPKAQGNARVAVYFTDGTHLDSFVLAPKAVTEPMSEDRVVTKCHNLT
jgi:hypothetical protein